MRDDPGDRFPSSDIPAGRFLIFISLWSLLVYNPVARWTWHWAGWSNQLGVMDFAGGTAVHITSGTTVLAFYVFYALQTKPKPEVGISTNYPHDAHDPPQPAPNTVTTKTQPENGDGNASESNSFVGSAHSNQGDNPGENAPQANIDSEAGTRETPASDTAPHNVNNIVLGTALLWIGWFGFNGGSALGGNLRAASACVSTHVAACAGGTTMLFLFWGLNRIPRYRTSIPSITHFCDGVVVGLVAITPGAGFVSHVAPDAVIGSLLTLC